MNGYREILKELTHTKVQENNEIYFLPSGAQSYERRWELLNKAKSSIHIATFSIMNDDTSNKLESILHAKLKQGVEVKIILDDIVNRTTFVSKRISRLRKSGALIHQYNNLFDEWLPFPKNHPFKYIIKVSKLKLKRHYHEKYMIVDGTELILGGINWGDKYAYGGIKPFAWRDTDVYIKGDVVADVQMQFLKDFIRYSDWDNRNDTQPSFYPEFVKTLKPLDETYIHKIYGKYFTNTQPSGNVAIQYVAHKPYDDNELVLTNVFLSLIKNAKKSIYWGCHGIRPPRIIGEYLANAVKRGVEVHLITNSKKSAKSLMAKGLLGWMYMECTKHYTWLLKRGIKIYEWQFEGAFHSKNFLVDDVVSSIGSYNIARGSTYHHSESNIFVYDIPFAKEVKKQFKIDFQNCQEVLLDNIALTLPQEDAFNRPLHERDLMILPELILPEIRQELNKHTYKRILT